MEVTIIKLYPGETCFGGGSGVIIPLRFGDPTKARPVGGGPEDISMLAAHNAIEDALNRDFDLYVAQREREQSAPDDDAPQGQPG